MDFLKEFMNALGISPFLILFVEILKIELTALEIKIVDNIHQVYKVIVFSTLLGVLSLTSALLMALAPAPLVPDAALVGRNAFQPLSTIGLVAGQQPLAYQRLDLHHRHFAFLAG